MTTNFPKMITGRIPKKEVQKMLTSLRAIPQFSVKKIQSGYEVRNLHNEIMFKAIHGVNSYLVRMPEDLFI